MGRLMECRRVVWPALVAALVTASTVATWTVPAAALTVSTNRAPDCTVFEAQDDAFRDSFASAFRCSRTYYNSGNYSYNGRSRLLSGFVGDTMGAAALFKPSFMPPSCGIVLNSPEMSSFYTPSCQGPYDHGTATLTMQGRNQFQTGFESGRERVVAGVDFVGNERARFYWTITHDNGEVFQGTPTQSCDKAGNNCSTIIPSGYPMPANAVSVYIRPVYGTHDRYDICFSGEADYGCYWKTTNVGSVDMVSAEQFAVNNHRSVPGNSRHRMEARNLQSLRFNGTWQFWAESETGMSSNGAAGFDRLSGPDYCLRTGNLPPDCYDYVMQPGYGVSGAVFYNGQSLFTPGQRFTAMMQSDGNFVVYDTSVPAARWASNTEGRPGSIARMQSDGNFVLVGPGNTPICSTRTDGNPGSVLIMQDDGNLVIYAPGRGAIWSSSGVGGGVCFRV